MPPNLKEWLPEDHLAWFILAAVEEMDVSAFLGAYRADGHGRPAHDPAMMLALLLYAYCKGQRSSRGIERECVEDVAYRVIAANQRPDHTTIARFRQRHAILARRIERPLSADSPRPNHMGTVPERAAARPFEPNRLADDATSAHCAPNRRSKKFATPLDFHPSSRAVVSWAPPETLASRGGCFTNLRRAHWSLSKGGFEKAASRRSPEARPAQPRRYEAPQRPSQRAQPRFSRTAYLNHGLPSSAGFCGGEWLWLVGSWFAPWMPGLIWVRDLVVGDVMVDRSFRVERLRPLGLCWAATLTWEPPSLRELVGSLGAIL